MRLPYRYGDILKKTTLYIDEEIYANFKAKCAEKGKFMTWVLHDLMEGYIGLKTLRNPAHTQKPSKWKFDVKEFLDYYKDEGRHQVNMECLTEYLHIHDIRDKRTIEKYWQQIETYFKKGEEILANE